MTEPRDGGCQEELGRRQLFSRVCYAAGAAIGALATLPVIGFVLAPIFRLPTPVWRRVGKLGDFSVGETVRVEYEDPSPRPWAGVTAQTAAWLRRIGDEEFEAFSINCRHLGCPVRWIADSELFMCPCHGGVYNKNGTVAAGPPPQPLEQYPVRVKDGEVEIQTSPIPLSLS